MSSSVSRSETQVAVLTAVGRGAVAVVAVSGPIAESATAQFFQAANGRALAQQPIGRIVYGNWGTGTGEDLIVCRREGEWLEIQCHGGSASIAQILDDLCSAGCKRIDWQQWIAHRSGCPIEASAQHALAAAPTVRTATILLDQIRGTLQQSVLRIRKQLCEGHVGQAREQIQKLLELKELGSHLTKPYRVVLAGKPNVGKSSLVNAIVGYQRAIVFDQPGTTRDVLVATTAVRGWPMQFYDTAGIHQGADELEEEAIGVSKDEFLRADQIVWVLDASSIEPNQSSDLESVAREQARTVGASIDWSRALAVLNKSDLSRGQSRSSKKVLATCAINGEGVPALLDRLAERLVPVDPLPGAAVPFTDGQIRLLEEALSCCSTQQASEAVSALERLLSARV